MEKGGILGGANKRGTVGDSRGADDLPLKGARPQSWGTAVWGYFGGGGGVCEGCNAGEGTDSAGPCHLRGVRDPPGGFVSPQGGLCHLRGVRYTSGVSVSHRPAGLLGGDRTNSRRGGRGGVCGGGIKGCVLRWGVGRAHELRGGGGGGGEAWNDRCAGGVRAGGWGGGRRWTSPCFAEGGAIRLPRLFCAQLLPAFEAFPSPLRVNSEEEGRRCESRPAGQAKITSSGFGLTAAPPTGGESGGAARRGAGRGGAKRGGAQRPQCCRLPPPRRIAVAMALCGRSALLLPPPPRPSPRRPRAAEAFVR